MIKPKYDEDLRTVGLKRLNMLILQTPSGDLRNTLTEINLLLHGAELPEPETVEVRMVCKNRLTNSLREED